jgi:hypothetical protein
MDAQLATTFWGPDVVSGALRRSKDLIDYLRPHFESRARDMGVEELVTWTQTLPREHLEAVVRLILEEWDLPGGPPSEDPNQTLPADLRLVKLEGAMAIPLVSRGKGVPPDKERLLASAGAKPVRFFLQLDGFADLDPDHLFGPDPDGDALYATHAWELSRTGLPVRVLIHEGTSRATALRLMRKLTELAERDWRQICEGPAQAL